MYHRSYSLIFEEENLKKNNNKQKKNIFYKFEKINNKNIFCFCSFIDSIIYPDNNILIKKINYIDTSCLFSNSIPETSISYIITQIMSLEFIDKENIDAIILYVINLLNKLNKKGFYLNRINCQKTIFILIVLACKIIEDYTCDINIWSTFTNVPLQEIKKMEFTILTLLDFNLEINISYQKALNIYKSLYF